MAHRPRTGITAATQSVLTDDPDFLHVLVERVVQAVLEAEMTAHLHADPYERSADRRGYRNGSKPRQLNTRVGTFSTQLFARYQRNEKALMLALYGDVRRRRFDPQSPRDHRSTVRVEFLEKPRLGVGRATRRRVGCMAPPAPDRDNVSVSERGCPLRTCPAGWSDHQPGRAHRRRCPRGWASGDSRGRGFRYRERSDVSALVSGSQGARPERGAIGDER